MIGELMIGWQPPPPPCTGQTLTFQVEALGGEPSYSWYPDDGESGFTLSGRQGPRIDISFAAESPGEYALGLNLRDGSGRTAHQTIGLSVYETPSVVTNELPAACPGQSYTEHLVARGGDPSSYHWSVDFGENNTLTHADDLISALPTQAGSITFQAKVADAHCTSALSQVTLPVDPVGLGQCPRIDTINLPPPCLASEYPATSFAVFGGTPPYTWRALPPLPDGLTFDASTVTLSGTAPAAGTLTIQVVDHAQRQVQKSYALTPRDKCWLAYRSTETGLARLYLFDPVLGTRRMLPESSLEPSDVSDFKFSPDGKYLAYRLAGSGGTTSLVIVQGPTWTERALDFQGSVLKYSWSENGSVLAVVFQTDAGTFLGGVDVSTPPIDPTLAADAGPPIAGFRMLASTRAPAIPSSQLIWFAGRFIAFPGPAIDPGYQDAYYAQLLDNGFASPTLMNKSFYLPPLELRAGQTGFFAITPVGDLDFYDIASNWSLNSYVGGFVDPAGRYVAQVEGSDVQFFRAEDANNSAAGATGCRKFLAWSPRRERIACVTDSASADGGTTGTTASGILSIFDLDTTKRQLQSQNVKGTYSYSEGASIERRRAISPTGSWFAFTIDRTLYVAAMTDVPWISATVPVTSDAVSESPFSELAFSPDERLLLWHRGSTLSLVNLEDASDSYSSLTTDPFPTPVKCGDNFVEASGNWCGDPGGAGNLAWSPDSRTAAAMTAAGVLMTWDFRTADKILGNRACQQGCTSDFSFQP